MVFLEEGPGVSKMSLALEQTPDLHRCNLEVALEQETFSRLQGLHPKRPLAPSPIDLGEVQEFRRLYQGLRVSTPWYEFSGNSWGISEATPGFQENLEFGVVSGDLGASNRAIAQIANIIVSGAFLNDS